MCKIHQNAGLSGPDIPTYAFLDKNKLYKNNEAETGKTKLEQIKNILRLSKSKK